MRALYVPRGLPEAERARRIRAAVAALAARCARALGGRTFVLTTTLRALQAIGERLRDAVRGATARRSQVLVQGSAPKRQLLQRFLGRRRASVLVGSQSFWEGIDVPGDALQCVVIDKLPFPPPNDPLVEARVKRLEAQGRNAVQRLLRRRGRGVAEAGRRAADPQRDRPRPAGGLRPAHGRHGLRPAPAARRCRR